jgi:hypothetical protein
VYNFVILISSLLAASFVLSPSVPAVEGVLDAIRTHQFVGLGESHGSLECHEFFRTLIRNDEVHRLVQDVVVEFGNPVYQASMDRYISGQEVSREELKKCWQNTGMVLAWDSPVYEEFFRAVRESNFGRPGDQKLRVVFVEPPINWSAVRTAEDYAPFAARSPDHYRIVKREVLDKGRRALVIFGSTHLVKTKDPHARHNGLGSYLNQNHPGSLYTIWPLFGDRPAFVEGTPPVLYKVAGTALASESFGQFMPKGLMALKKVDGKTVQVPINRDDYPPVEQLVDAILYLGKASTPVPAPGGLYQGAYLKELRRRGAILKGVFGVDFTEDLEP